jgi:hypothetical protein
MDTLFSPYPALAAAGDLLARRGEHAAIVVVGGTALNLLGIVSRVTRDVDVIAIGTPSREGEPADLRAPDRLPQPLADVIATVSRDLGLPIDWLNTVVAVPGRVALPPGFALRLSWRQYGGLWVGIVGRFDLICLKLHAAADQADAGSRHFADLMALAPSDEDLAAAVAWVRTQDPSAPMALVLDLVIEHVRKTRQ